MGAMVETQRGVALANTAADQGQYLTFMLGGEVFAIGILRIKEIIEWGEITDVPMMPEFIRGVINLRGRVVPVIDLAARFGRGATTVARRTCIVIVEALGEEADDAHQDLGIMVDAVNEVVEIASTDIEPAPSFGARIRPDFISGMAKRDDRFVVVLNVDRVLSIDEMATLSQPLPLSGQPLVAAAESQ